MSKQVNLGDKQKWEKHIRLALWQMFAIQARYYKAGLFKEESDDEDDEKE